MDHKLSRTYEVRSLLHRETTVDAIIERGDQGSRLTRWLRNWAHRTVRTAATVAFVMCTVGIGIAPIRAADPVQLYGIFSLTGYAAFLGQADLQALEALEARVNKAGGIAGRPVHFTVYDDQSNPATAVQLANGVAAKNGVAIVGPSLSGTCNAVAPTLSKTTGPMMFCMSGAVQTEGNPFVFGGGTGYDFAKASMNYIQGRGWSRVGLLSTTDATGADAERSIKDLLASQEFRKLSLVANEHFGVADLSVIPQLARMKAAGAQCLIVWTTGTGFGTALHGVQDLGMGNLPIITAPGNGVAALMRPLAAYMPKELYVSAYDGVAPDKVTDRAVRARMQQWRKDYAAIGISNPDPLAIIGYDAGSLYIEALRHFGPDATAAQLRDWISIQRHYVGVSAVYDFQRVPHHGIDSSAAYIARWDPASQTFIGVSKAGGTL